LGLRVVHDGVPHRAATTELPPIPFPRGRGFLHGLVFEALRWIARHRVEAPQLLAGLGVVRADVATHTVLAAGVADEHLAARDARSARDRVVLALVDRDDEPRFLTRLRVDCDETTIERA